MELFMFSAMVAGISIPFVLTLLDYIGLIN
jgi:hypothetical protein